MSNTVETRASLIAQASALINKPVFTKEDSAKFGGLMQLADAMGAEDNYRRARINGVMAENAGEPADQQFRKFVNTGGEVRTYSALNIATGSQGGLLVPNQWRKDYQQKLVSASGLLRAGATLLDLDNGRPYVHFFMDDTANEAEILAENAQLSSANNPSNPVVATKIPVLNKYATSCVASSEVLQDSQIDLNAALQNFFGQRVARKFNAYATSDATNGIINHLSPAATAGLDVPTHGELATMQGEIDSAYLEDPDSAACYMMSPAMQNSLLQAHTDTGAQLYPELNQGRLLGYPVILNVDMSSSAGSIAVVFGSMKRAIIVHSAPLILVRSVEMFATSDATYFALFHRLGAKLVDAAAITALQLAS